MSQTEKVNSLIVVGIDLRTPHVIEKHAKELEIYNEFIQLSAIPGAMRSQVAKVVSDRYKLRSSATIYSIRRRVEKRLSQSSLAK